jgi:hypothetical protein
MVDFSSAILTRFFLIQRLRAWRLIARAIWCASGIVRQQTTAMTPPVLASGLELPPD